MELSFWKACILGHAVGDALGVPVEFSSREALEKQPVIGLRGYGFYPFPAGTWSDDTSMTLAALEVFTQAEFSWEAVMRNFGRWYFDGCFTPTGETFAVGRTCRTAIENYFLHQKPLASCAPCDAHSNGNGALMRILPFALSAPGDLDFAEKASALTHAHRRSQISCGIYALILSKLEKTREKSAIACALQQAQAHYEKEEEWPHFAPLLTLSSREKSSIRSSGYVVDTLEAALWCLLQTETYRDCVLTAVNLGSDTDTVAAVAGGLAGVLYGLSAIPEAWLSQLAKREEIERLCEKAQENQ